MTHTMSMWEPFTKEARRAIVLSQEETQRAGGNRIGSEQILLGLLADPECTVAKLLGPHGVTIDKARGAVQTLHGETGAATEAEMIFTPEGKRVIELAFEVARQTKTQYVGAVHLFLGTVREQSGAAPHVLRQLNTSPAELEKRALELIAGAASERPSRRFTKDPTLGQALEAASSRETRSDAELLADLETFTKAYGLEAEGGQSRAAMSQALRSLLILAVRRGWNIDELFPQ